MQYTATYRSPLGGILLAADETGLTGLWFEGAKYFAADLGTEYQPREDLPVFHETVCWLEQYFSGKEPDFTPSLHLKGTAFQRAVWERLLRIPYGETTTYGALAAELATQMGRKSMSAQAVGGAVGHNKISLIVPCHRVLGTGGALTGYAGGLEKKTALLSMERGEGLIV